MNAIKLTYYLCPCLISFLDFKYFRGYAIKPVERGLKKSLFCSFHASLTQITETVIYSKLYLRWIIWNYLFYKAAVNAIQKMLPPWWFICRRLLRWLSSGNFLIMIIFCLGTPSDETVISTTRSVVSQPISEFALRSETIDIKRQNRIGKKEFKWCGQHIVTQIE